MKKFFKNQKGINLVTLSITVIILISISGIVLYNVFNNIQIQKLQSMQSDIENLKGKVSNYYLQYGALPILKNQEIDESILEDNVKTITNSYIDKGKYYIIDLSAMENVTLNYGEDYEKIKEKPESEISTLSNNTLIDLYIINSVSHNIFYVAGIKCDGKMYYREYQDVENTDIGLSEIDFDNVEKENWSPTYSSNKKYKDKNEDIAIIPEGFQVSRKSGEDTIENGLVVRDSNENEWVWIPVSKDDLALMYEENSPGWIMSGTTNVYTKYISRSMKIGTQEISRNYSDNNNREPDMVANSNADYNPANYRDILGFSTYANLTQNFVDEYKNMIDSIKINGGFYIGRYELGKDENDNDNPQIKKGTVMNNTSWYNLYMACKTFSTEKVESRMIWGCQWDQACKFVSEHGDKVNPEDSKEYGNYSDSTVSEDICGSTNFNGETGRSDNWKANNIYDIAGNCIEFTQEAYGVSSRSCRGGDYRRSGSRSIIFRSGGDPSTFKNNYSTSRPILYIK